MTEQRVAQHLEVRWVGPCARLFAGADVLYLGTDDLALHEAVGGASFIAVDPGKPCGVAIWPLDTGYPISLHEADPTVLADALLGMAQADDLHICCETPLHGAMRVYDPEPWKLRGFLEHFQTARRRARHGNLFIPAQVDWLHAGGNLAKVNTPGVSRHAKDALAYGAVAVTMNGALIARLEAR